MTTTETFTQIESSALDFAYDNDLDYDANDACAARASEYAHPYDVDAEATIIDQWSGRATIRLYADDVASMLAVLTTYSGGDAAHAHDLLIACESVMYERSADRLVCKRVRATSLSTMIA